MIFIGLVQYSERFILCILQNKKGNLNELLNMKKNYTASDSLANVINLFILYKKNHKILIITILVNNNNNTLLIALQTGANIAISFNIPAEWYAG